MLIQNKKITIILINYKKIKKGFFIKEKKDKKV